MKKILLFLFFLACVMKGFSQIPTDGLMMAEKTLCTGFMYTHDQWKNYWEGTLKRDNQNIGTLTNTSLMWYGVYGLNPKINLMASLPYVKTEANMGTLHGMVGIQDLMLAGKYKLIDAQAGPAKLRMFGVLQFSTPLTNYTPDFLPMSIGLASTTGTARLNINYSMDEKGPYINGTAAYTLRSNVTLDRETYYSDGAYYHTNEVDMPNVFDYKFDVGYHKGPLQVEATWIQMVTLGGGDIRRQDMPFVSYKMNASRVGGLVMYYLPWPKDFGVRAMVTHVVSGRNVGQSTSYMGGILYTIHFKKRAAETAN